VAPAHGVLAAPGQTTPRPGCLMPGIWLGIGVLITLGGLGAIVLGAIDSERAGVAMSYVAAGPLGLAWSGALAAAVIQLFVRKAGTGVRAGVPIGCGLVGGIVAFVLLLVFFEVVWPEL
jgi:hypothetical protein